MKQTQGVQDSTDVTEATQTSELERFATVTIAGSVAKMLDVENREDVRCVSLRRIGSGVLITINATRDALQSMIRELDDRLGLDPATGRNLHSGDERKAIHRVMAELVGGRTRIDEAIDADRGFCTLDDAPAAAIIHNGVDVTELVNAFTPCVPLCDELDCKACAHEREFGDASTAAESIEQSPAIPDDSHVATPARLARPCSCPAVLKRIGRHAPRCGADVPDESLDISDDALAYPNADANADRIGRSYPTEMIELEAAPIAEPIEPEAVRRARETYTKRQARFNAAFAENPNANNIAQLRAVTTRAHTLLQLALNAAAAERTGAGV